MMNVANNSRKRYTQKRIKEAFLQLIVEKDIQNIKIQEICDIAEVNRSTFYNNYEDIYFLSESIKKDLETDVEKIFDSVNVYDESEYNFLKLFKHIKENQSIYKAYFKLNTNNIIVDENMYSRFLANKYFAGKDIEYHIVFFKAGLNAVISKWLDGGCKESPEEIDMVIMSEYKDRHLL